MARPLRLEFPGAIYHVTACGNALNTIFFDGEDRTLFLDCPGGVVAVARFGWLCHAHCLMVNHYHLSIKTPESNLSPGMRQLSYSNSISFSE